jgi:hypothetical protein
MAETGKKKKKRTVGRGEGGGGEVYVRNIELKLQGQEYLQGNYRTILCVSSSSFYSIGSYSSALSCSLADTISRRDPTASKTKTRTRRWIICSKE